jgi:hypothetical protein
MNLDSTKATQHGHGIVKIPMTIKKLIISVTFLKGKKKNTHKRKKKKKKKRSRWGLFVTWKIEDEIHS